MDSFFDHFAIVDLCDNEGFKFSLLVSNTKGTIISPYNLLDSIKYTSAKGAPFSLKKEYSEFVKDYFAEKPNVHETQSIYFVKHGFNFKSIKFRDYKSCSICDEYFLTRSAVDHIISCAATTTGETLDKSDAAAKTIIRKGFFFKTDDGAGLYVILKDSHYYSVPPNPPTPDLIEDAFVREKQLLRYLDDPLASKCQIPKETNVVLWKAVCDFFQLERAVFTGDNPILLLFLDTNLNDTVLSAGTHLNYAAFVTPILFLLAVVDETFSFLLSDFDLSRFNQLAFERLCCSENLFIPSLIKAIYFCFIVPSKRIFKDSIYRCNVFKSIRWYLVYITYDGLKKLSSNLRATFDWFNKNTIAFEKVSDTNSKYHETLPQNDVRIDGPGKVYVGGTRYTIDMIRLLVDELAKDYNAIIESFLPAQLHNVEGIMNYFCTHVNDDHSNSAHGYTPFEDSKLRDKLVEYLNIFQKFMAEGAENTTLDKLLYLCRLVCIMVQLTVGPPFRVNELSFIRHRNFGTMKRSLYFNSRDRVFNIQLTYNKNNSLSQKYNCYNKCVPTQVSSYLVHMLFVVRPIVLNLFGEEPNVDYNDSFLNASIPNIDDSINSDDLDDQFADDCEISDEVTKIELISVIKSYAFVTHSGKISHSHFTTTLNNFSRKYLKEEWKGRSLRQALCVLTVQGIPHMFPNGIEDIIKQAAGHSPDTHDTIYLRASSGDIPSAELAICRSWHQLLGFDHPLFLHSRQSRFYELHNLVLSLNFLGFKEIDKVGRSLFGPDFSFFSPTIREAAQYIYSCLDKVMVNTPTGSGKSLTYLIPALLEKKAGLPFITVIVVPFVALLNDAFNDIKQHINSRIYDNEHDAALFDDTDILFVQVEHFERFRKVLEQFDSQNIRKFIRRIVIDEFHVLQRDWNYRPQLLLVKNSLSLPFSFVFLSATVNAEIFLTIRQKSSTQIECFKDTTVKTNVMHSQINYHDVRLVVGYLRDVKLVPGKIIILLNDKVKAQNLANALKCLYYSSDLRSGDGKKAIEVYERFKSPKSPGDHTIVCTSGFSTGLNIEGITHAIIAHGGNDMVLYQQLTGRLNRKKYNAPGYVYLLSHSYNTFNQGDCINRKLSVSFDGVDKDCAELGCIKCSVCDKSNTITREQLVSYEQNINAKKRTLVRREEEEDYQAKIQRIQGLRFFTSAKESDSDSDGGQVEVAETSKLSDAILPAPADESISSDDDSEVEVLDILNLRDSIIATRAEETKSTKSSDSVVKTQEANDSVKPTQVIQRNTAKSCESDILLDGEQTDSNGAINADESNTTAPDDSFPSTSSDSINADKSTSDAAQNETEAEFRSRVTESSRRNLFIENRIETMSFSVFVNTVAGFPLLSDADYKQYHDIINESRFRCDLYVFDLRYYGANTCKNSCPFCGLYELEYETLCSKHGPFATECPSRFFLSLFLLINPKLFESRKNSILEGNETSIFRNNEFYRFCRTILVKSKGYDSIKKNFLKRWLEKSKPIVDSYRCSSKDIDQIYNDFLAMCNNKKLDPNAFKPQTKVVHRKSVFGELEKLFGPLNTSMSEKLFFSIIQPLKKRSIFGLGVWRIPSHGCWHCSVVPFDFDGHKSRCIDALMYAIAIYIFMEKRELHKFLKFAKNEITKPPKTLVRFTDELFDYPNGTDRRFANKATLLLKYVLLTRGK